MKQDNSERTLLYLNNGDTYMGDNYTLNEAKRVLKQKGYTVAYSGRKFTANGIKVLVGIDSQNHISLAKRRENGLYRAVSIHL